MWLRSCGERAQVRFGLGARKTPHRFRPKTAESASPLGEGEEGSRRGQRGWGLRTTTSGRPLTDFRRRRRNLPLPQERVKRGGPARGRAGCGSTRVLRQAEGKRGVDTGQGRPYRGLAAGPEEGTHKGHAYRIGRAGAEEGAHKGHAYRIGRAGAEEGAHKGHAYHDRTRRCAEDGRPQRGTPLRGSGGRGRKRVPTRGTPTEDGLTMNGLRGRRAGQRRRPYEREKDREAVSGGGGL